MEEKKTRDIIINVGCEYGSGGPDIGKIIAKDWGIPCYDRALIDRIIEETGLSKGVADLADTGADIRGRRKDLNDTASPSKYAVLTDRVVHLQTRIVQKLAERGPCVIIGRCADYILRDRPDILNVFIYAPKLKRLEHIEEALKVSPEAADILIEKNDRYLRARYEQMTGTYMGDRHNRHILIDSSVLGLERTAALIEDFARGMFPAEKARQGKKTVNTNTSREE